MNEADIIEITKQGVWVLIKISGPLLLLAMAIGLFIALFQALTQIQEMTITFVPKIIAIFIAIVLLAPFMIRQLQEYSILMFDKMVGLT